MAGALRWLWGAARAAAGAALMAGAAFFVPMSLAAAFMGGFDQPLDNPDSKAELAGRWAYALGAAAILLGSLAGIGWVGYKYLLVPGARAAGWMPPAGGYVRPSLAA
ncbi:hypothetical protein ABPG77_000449 [Micractinium sp. CCAP 211/92]